MAAEENGAPPIRLMNFVSEDQLEEARKTWGPQVEDGTAQRDRLLFESKREYERHLADQEAQELRSFQAAVATQSNIVEELKETPPVPKDQDQKLVGKKKPLAHPYAMVVKNKPQAKKAKLDLNTSHHHHHHHQLLVLVSIVLFLMLNNINVSEGGFTAVGDPGMKTDSLRVAFEAWNFCNEVAHEAPNMGSPRAADCFNYTTTTLIHRVTDSDNKLGVGKPFQGLNPKALNNPDLYAAEKELYLGSLCQGQSSSWQFWMIMLKNGNYDTRSGLCPENGKKVPPFNPGRFPCFGDGCMNQPLFYHQPTTLIDNHHTMRGGFNGTYDLTSSSYSSSSSSSYFEVVWEKKVGVGSWVFNHKLKTSKLYPWLMLYLRADATKGFSGGYHYETRGMLTTLPESPNFKVKLTLDVKKGGGPKSQFYLIDIGSCWKNNGETCDGDVLTDVTRYSEMIINPDTPAWCSPTNIANCPPYHITPNNTRINRNDTAHFPYAAYHYYCAPGTAQHLEKPYSTCDPYSNPQAQELVQLLPHPIWAEYGYPTKQGQGWVGDAKTWELDVGGLSGRLYFYQDPGTTPARRIWTSLDVGTEIFVSDKDEEAEWTLSNFDVILTAPPSS